MSLKMLNNFKQFPKSKREMTHPFLVSLHSQLTLLLQLLKLQQNGSLPQGQTAAPFEKWPRTTNTAKSAMATAYVKALWPANNHNGHTSAPHLSFYLARCPIPLHFAKLCPSALSFGVIYKFVRVSIHIVSTRRGM